MGIASFLLFFLSLLVSSNGLILKIIRRDSIDWPYHTKNMTRSQRLNEMIEITKSRAHMLGLGLKLNKYDIEASISRSIATYYMVELQIGTPPSPFLLMLDTGSGLIWIQTKMCRHCFDIRNGSFGHYESDSFRYLECDESACPSRQCDQDDYCSYSRMYGDGSKFTSGILGTDYFSFHSQAGGTERISLTFGLAYDNTIAFGDPSKNEMAGVFGLSFGPLSFLTQLDSYQETYGRFSYCLPSMEKVNTLLKFGEDADTPDIANHPRVQTTPLIPGDLYFLNCTGISVDGKSLNLPKDAFGPKFGYASSFIIDTGSPLTLLSSDVFTEVANAVDDYYKLFQLRRIRRQMYTGFCYRFPEPEDYYSVKEDFDYYPDITFHFQDADFTLQHTSAFYPVGDIFCLAIKPYHISLLGAHAQINHVIMTDTTKNTLSFHPERCP